MIFILTKVNSIYGDVSREGLLATGALLLGAGGENFQKHFKMSNDYLGFAGLLGPEVIIVIIVSMCNLGYLFLDKVDALPSLEKVARAFDKVTLLPIVFNSICPNALEVTVMNEQKSYYM